MIIKEDGNCSLCGKPYYHYGNNPEPVLPYWERVCDDCNMVVIIPMRIKKLQSDLAKKEIDNGKCK